jgi:hypothetical protein
MSENEKDAGVIQALLERFEKFRMPMVLELNEREIEYLEQVLQDAHANRALVDRHPEWQKVSAQIVSLYKHITEKALENEKNA